ISAYETGTDKFIKVLAKENSDGIKCDRRGNLFLCNEEGLLILNNQGERLALIKLPETPANICWGGIGLNDLLITARQYVLLISNLQCPS
ncbi:MAG TPA: SMP-30/gluconolactonase/LRE family protein, partial [Flavisolibacter sp.]|nr:SMP-30/gluconolactonase/LRE family protein [Flavisolibacter sp.]